MTAASATSKGKILVVDDDRLVLATLTHGLSHAGYEVIDADNGDDAILLARAAPAATSRCSTSAWKARAASTSPHYLRDHCHMPFMFLSAFSDEQTVAQVKALGAVAYLVKPLDIGQIVPAVEAAFAHIGTQAAAPPRRAAAAPPAPVGASARDTSAAMAVGVLMHRYSLSARRGGGAAARLAARRRAARMHAQAELLLAAVEQLAGPARH